MENDVYGDCLRLGLSKPPERLRENPSPVPLTAVCGKCRFIDRDYNRLGRPAARRLRAKHPIVGIAIHSRCKGSPTRDDSDKKRDEENQHVTSGNRARGNPARWPHEPATATPLPARSLPVREAVWR